MSSKLFVIIAGGVGESAAADILVIDGELHDADPVTQSVVNQADEYTANRLLVLPDRVSSHGCSL